MAEKLSHPVEIQEEMIRVLLANNRAIMDIAMQMELTPREVRNILQETLLQFGEPVQRVDDRIPIAAKAPPDLLRLTTEELRSLLDKTSKHS